jgi:hypothetical protein
MRPYLLVRGRKIAAPPAIAALVKNTRRSIGIETRNVPSCRGEARDGAFGAPPGLLRCG